MTDHVSRRRWISTAALVTAGWLLAASPFEAAKIEIKTDRDETFSFAGLRTWTWHADGPGETKVAYASATDPKPIDQRMRPVILAAVEREFAKRKMTKATDERPDLVLHYYLLVTASTWTQSMGEFAPAVTEWGLPPFSPQTTAMKVLPIGTFLLDMSSPGRDGLVWRGAARAEINLDRSTEERAKNVDRAITELFKKFPTK